MINLLLSNPLLLLFLVAAIGYPLGKLTIRGTSLGIAAVLFVGIAFGSLHPNLKVPSILYELGLGLFVYTLGLSNSAAFFTSLKRRGLRDNLLIASGLILAVGLTIAIHKWFHLKVSLTVGLFAGSLTNTPALASVLETIRTSVPKETLTQMLTEPVVGYSIAYPMGVVGMILVMLVLQKIWKIDYAAEALTQHEFQTGGEKLCNQTIRVTNPNADHQTLKALEDEFPSLVFGRIKHEASQSLATPETRLHLGDLVSVIGSPESVAQVTHKLGEATTVHLELDRSRYDFRRVFVSNHEVAGHRLADLNLMHQFGAIVTRIRRGDIDLIAQDNTILELGDRVRVVADRDHLDAVSKFFGDSYRESSEVDILTFSLGLALGLLVGTIPIPVSDDIKIKLGLAGGPLVIALILGKLERTGPLVWVPPFSVSQAIRQIGLVIFLAGIGTHAGYSFVSTLTSGGGIWLLLAGMMMTCSVALVVLVVGYKVLKIPMGLLIGIVSGMQTQPALLGFALEQTKNDLPNIGYASVFPVATVLKIILVQVLFALLSH